MVMVHRQLKNWEAALIAADSLRVIEDSVFFNGEVQTDDEYGVSKPDGKKPAFRQPCFQDIRNKAALQIQKAA